MIPTYTRFTAIALYFLHPTIGLHTCILAYLHAKCSSCGSTILYNLLFQFFTSLPRGLQLPPRLHQLQLQQERLVLDSGTYLDQHLIQHLQVSA